MNLEQFAKTYELLEDKARGIIVAYGGKEFDFDNIDIDMYKGEYVFIIEASSYSYGSFQDNYRLTFGLHEVGNDMIYFKNKHLEEVKQNKLREESLQRQIREQRLLTQERKDLENYERLKDKYG